MIELYERLKPKLGKAGARDLPEFIEKNVERRTATKEDLGGSYSHSSRRDVPS